MRLSWKSIITKPIVYGVIALSGWWLDINPMLAQSLKPSDLVPTTPNPPEVPPQFLPPVDDLLKPNNQQTRPSLEAPDPSKTFIVREFRVIDSTVFSADELAEVVKPFTNRPIRFAELLQARVAIADLYIRNGYITSGAFIPPQETDNGIVTIQVIEGKLEDIQITGTNRLDSSYIRSRLEVATGAPLNRDRLLNALQLLQIDPLLESVSAELKAGQQLGTNILAVKVTEAKSFSVRANLDNSAPASVGQLQRQVEVNERNLSGVGDRLALIYGNTDGRNQYNLSYTIPINPYNGSLSLSFNNANSKIITPEFKSLDIFSNSTVYDLTFRQPLIQTPVQEFALGATLSHSESFTTLLKLPIPISSGADDFGRTKLTTLRFFQDYTQRSSQDILALRSQISFGLGGVLNSTINANFPDSRFVAWWGQAQYIRQLDDDALLIVSGGLQFADRPLPASEQFSVGGNPTGRGYRQDALVGDNGLNVSVEARLPVLSFREIRGLLQIAPFIDVGTVQNQNSSDTSTNTWLLGTGLGLRWQMGDRLIARFDYGFPLIPIKGSRNSWQEHGIYFSLSYGLF